MADRMRFVFVMPSSFDVVASFELSSWDNRMVKDMLFINNTSFINDIKIIPNNIIKSN